MPIMCTGKVKGGDCWKESLPEAVAENILLCEECLKKNGIRNLQEHNK